MVITLSDTKIPNPCDTTTHPTRVEGQAPTRPYIYHYHGL